MSVSTKPPKPTVWRSLLRRPSWWQTPPWHQHRDQSEWTEAWDCHKLQEPGLSYSWWGFQAWDTLQDSTDNSRIDKVETSLEWHEYFSQFQDTTDALPCHIHLPVRLWIMDPHSRAPKKNTGDGNKVLRKILRISYKDLVTNEKVRAKIQQTIGPHEDLLTMIKRRKLQWYGHVSRSSGLAKTILQGTVKGGRRQSRQRKWEDNIREWTDPEFVKSQRAVENRQNWRKLVMKSSVVPQRPSRLRDRWWWWWWWASVDNHTVKR